MSKKLFSKFVIFLFITLSCTNEAYAAPTDDFDAIKNSNTETQTKINDTLNKVNELDSQLSELMIKINKNKDEETKLNSDINKTNDKIKVEEKKLKTKKELCGKRLRVMYMNNCDNDLLLLLFNSKDFDEFLEKAEAIGKIVNLDNKLINDIKTSQKILKTQSDKLQNDKKALINISTKNQKEQEQIVAQKKDLMAALENLKTARAKEIENAEADYLTKKLQNEFLTYIFPDLRLPKKEIESKNNMDFYSASDLQTSIKVKPDDIIMYSVSLIGVSYVWGGNDARGLDCSGFTKYVYKHFGIIIPRVAADQQKVGVDINNQDDLQPGDLLFYGQPAHHVAIFVTKGFMIEAPYTGETIKISPIRPYTSAKRYINITPEQISANTHIYPKTGIQPNELDDDVKELPSS